MKHNDLQLTKWCSKCETEKPLGEFQRNKREKDRHSGKCWICRRGQIYERRKVAREFIGKYLSEHPCVDCGETNIICLDFDHVHGVHPKKRGIYSMVAGGNRIETIKKEIEKCDVRCSNCHRIKTAERQGGVWRVLYHASGTLG